MSATFYSVLGVGPEADETAIRAGYRERVKDVHPDVNDDPDADAQFKRIQTARETLLDGSERARYDRLGHTSYVSRHVDCSAWTGEDAPGDGRRTGPRYGSTADVGANTTTSTGTTRSAGGPDPESNTADASGPGSDRGGTGPGTRAGTGRSAGTHTSGTSGSAGGGPSWTDPGSGATGNARRGGQATGEASSRRGPGGRRARARWGAGTGPAPSDSTTPGARGGTASKDRTATEEGPAGTAGSSRRHGADTAGRASSPYAESNFWQARPSEDGCGTRRPDPVGRRVIDGLRRLGPWVFVHLAFLSAAVGTCLYAYEVVLADAAASLPLLLVLIGEVGLAMLLSSIHVISKLSR